MLFQCIDREGKVSMWTKQKCCVPSQEEINDRARAGYKFKVDGKIVPRGKVLEAVSQSKSEFPNDYVIHKVSKDDSDDIVEKINENKINVLKNIEPISPSKPSKRKTKKVRCIENNTIYNSMSEAGRSLGIDPAGVSDAVKRNKPVKGYTFEIVED